MKKIFFLLLGFVVFTLISCKKVQPDMNTKDCNCAKEVSAYFTMGQEFMGEIIDLDTIHYYPSFDFNNGNVTSYLNGNCKVVFSANYENAISYQWQVGENTTIKTSKKFELYFGDTVGTIQIRLIVHAKPNKICFPFDDGIDTITRNLTIMVMEKPYLTGKFLGSNIDSPNDKFLIEFDTASILTSNFNRYISYGVHNLPFGNTHSSFDDLNSVSFSGWTDDDNDLITFYNTLNGYYDRKNKKITINYSARYYNSNNQIIKQLENKTFIGTKIN
jgi:hypothetical protein